MHIRTFKAAFPVWSRIISAEDFLANVKTDYRKFRDQGLFDTYPKDALYIYQIRNDKRWFTGLLACTDIRDYLAGSIKKHEKTMAVKEAKQVELLHQRQATVKPVTLLYPDVDNINTLLKEYTINVRPDFVISLGSEKHLVWCVEEKAGIQKLQELFKEEVPHAYIADGHHRSAAMAFQYQQRGCVSPFDQMLCAFFPSSELEIHDFNRVIKNLGRLSPIYFMARLSACCDIEPIAKAFKPHKKHQMLLYLDEEWFRLTWKKEVLKPLEKEAVILDADLLNEYILKGILGIVDVRNDLRISYVEGPKGLEAIQQKVLKGDKNRMAFCLYPVQMEEMFIVADHE
ncbi:MAG: DUF1015 domain-containing protein, partial [Saprospiraceae bacterium]|nr:DUF1015 domain-containing protein [Saprospiraceae bacterium]